MAKDEGSPQQRAEAALISSLRDYFISGGDQDDVAALVDMEWESYSDFIAENNTTDAEQARKELDDYIEENAEEINEETEEYEKG